MRLPSTSYASIILDDDPRLRPHRRAEFFTARVATMHRAKGLEFDEVILISKPGNSPGSTQHFDKQPRMRRPDAGQAERDGDPSG